jgi:endoribonuclease Dicer
MKRNDSMSIIVHDFAVVGPIPASNISLAKGLAAERARQVLEDPESPYFLSRICDCREHDAGGDVAMSDGVADVEPGKKPDDETEEGFAALARAALAEVEETGTTTREVKHGQAEDSEDIDIIEDPDLDIERIIDEDKMEIDSGEGDQR